MNFTEESSPAWRIVTSVLHLLSVSVLSFCLARRSFFHLERKPLHPALRTSHTATSHANTYSRSSHFQESQSLSVRSHSGVFRNAVQYVKSCRLSNYRLRTTCARLTAFMTLATSLLFALCSAIMITGFGLDNEANIPSSQLNGLNNAVSTPDTSCYIINYFCIFLYGLTKIFVYLFLIERVYLVSSAGTTPSRLSTKTYRIGLLALVIYTGILVIMGIGHLATVTPVQPSASNSSILEVCTIGLHLYAALPLIIYGIIFTITLTAMFVIPIARSGGDGQEVHLWPDQFFTIFKTRPKGTSIRVLPFSNPTPNVHVVVSPSQSHLTGRQESIDEIQPTSPDHERPSSWAEFELEGVHSDDLRRLAKRSLLASLIGLITSSVNLFVMASRGGKEEAATCMRWCLADVVVNALAVYAVMQGREEWWRGAAAMPRPTESLPRGIWDETDLGHENQGARLSKASSLRAAGTSRVKRASLGFMDDNRLLSAGRKRLSAIAALAKKDDPPTHTAQSRRVSLQVDTDHARDMFKTSLPEAEESPRSFMDKGKGREDGWSSNSSIATMKQHSQELEFRSIPRQDSDPLPSISVQSPGSNNTSPNSFHVSHSSATETVPTRTRSSLQINLPSSTSRRRWSSVEPPPPLSRHYSYT